MQHNSKIMILNYNPLNERHVLNKETREQLRIYVIYTYAYLVLLKKNQKFNFNDTLTLNQNIYI